MTVLRAVSISLGGSQRDQRTETTLLGTPVLLERIGVDGDLDAARRKFLELDDQVDAFGVGGADLGVHVANRYYPLHSVSKLVAGLKTPAVDGGVVRRVVEGAIVPRLEQMLPVPIQPKRVFFCAGVGRYDMALSFQRAGYSAIYGDLGFGLGLPVAMRSLATVRRVARLLMPIMGRLPFSWIYPTGPDQDEIVPKFGDWYNWATVIADDFHYIKQHMPERLDGKIIVTNTTTLRDVDLLRERGAAYLCTVTPRLQGRSFGTNVIEAALTAIAGKGRALTPEELNAMLSEDDLIPTIVALNPPT